MRAALPSIGLTLALALLAACGFQLRGAYSLPYESLFIAMPDYSVIAVSLKRAIRASGTTRVALTASDAQATLVPGAESRDRVILSVSSTGRVSELRLRYLYHLSDHRQQGPRPGRTEQHRTGPRSHLRRLQCAGQAAGRNSCSGAIWRMIWCSS
jgi:outer membrane lipopolysaccharide assembly protein LptE/RlpB